MGKSVSPWAVAAQQVALAADAAFVAAKQAVLEAEARAKQGDLHSSCPPSSTSAALSLHLLYALPAQLQLLCP
jgi:hypothetical protein